MKKRILILGILLSVMLVGCGKSKLAKETEKLISSIGEVTLDSIDTIEQAEKYYSALTESQKNEVDNYIDLLNAREQYNSLLENLVSNPFRDDNQVVYDSVIFGNYEHEPITWRVLKVENTEALLLSDRLLDRRPYDSFYDCKDVTDMSEIKKMSLTWENSELRNWLNNQFYEAAFTEKEQSAIIEVNNVNSNNPKNNTPGGNDTVDKVYLLSLEDMQKEEYGFYLPADDELGTTVYNDAAKVAGFTKYSDSKMNYDEYSDYEHGDWWLRTIGSYSYMQTLVLSKGRLTDSGNFGNFNKVGVRPCIKLDLTSTEWTKADQIVISVR